MKPSPDATYVLVPTATLQQLTQDVKDIKQALASQATVTSAYLSEAEAAAFLGKKRGWLWEQRTKGRLRFTKVGRNTFYKRADLEALLEDGIVEPFR